MTTMGVALRKVADSRSQRVEPAARTLLEDMKLLHDQCVSCTPVGGPPLYFSMLTQLPLFCANPRSILDDTSRTIQKLERARLTFDAEKNHLRVC